jgi:hypothetical protein
MVFGTLAAWQYCWTHPQYSPEYPYHRRMNKNACHRCESGFKWRKVPVHRHSAGRIRKSRRPFDYHRQPESSSTGWIDCGPVRPHLVIRNGCSRTHRRAKANSWRSWSKAAPAKRSRRLAISVVTIKNHMHSCKVQSAAAATPPPDVGPLCNLLLRRSLVRVMRVAGLACLDPLAGLSATVVNLPVQPKWPRRQC